MKHALVALCALAIVAMLLVPTSASAQNAYNVKDKVISAGIGLGNVAGFYGTTTIPPIFVAFETGLPLEELKNKLTVGGTVGYAGSSEDYYWAKYSYTYIFFGVNGNYHFLEKNPKIDAFAGLGLGYSIANSSVEYKAGYDANDQYAYSVGSGYFAYDIHVGARYYFTPKFAVHAELGWGFGIFRIGVSYKL
jgi:hypothetical protein